MGLITGIVLFVLGVLASASTIVAKRPDAQAAIDKLVPYQGWIGFVCAIWGVLIVISALLNLNWLSYGRLVIWWITYFATGALEFALGLLLGYALLTQFLLSKSAEAMKRGEQVRSVLVPYQTTLGFVSIALGIWTMVASFMFTV
jgi:hypothetical protein